MLLGSATLVGCAEEQVNPLPKSGGAGAGGSAKGGSATGGGFGGEGPLYPLLGCDPLVPEHCGLPFPSKLHTVADETSPTGRRVSFTDEFFPAAANGNKPQENPWAASDGFSPGSALVTFLPGAASDGLVTPEDVADSITTSSKTLLVDVATGMLGWCLLADLYGYRTRRIGGRGAAVQPALESQRRLRRLLRARGEQLPRRARPTDLSGSGADALGSARAQRAWKQ